MRRYRLEEELTILDPKQIVLERDAYGDLRMNYQGQIYEKVHLRRAFPLTHADRYIIIFADKEEIGLLENVHDLPRKSRHLAQEELRRAYFIPVITRILELEESYGASKWKVETDHGIREFDIRSRDDIKPFPPFRILFRDAEGNRYEIPDYRKLDRRSQVLLESET